MPEQFIYDHRMLRHLMTVPQGCPQCHSNVVQRPTSYRVRPGSDELAALFVCINIDCQSWFLAYYDLSEVRPPEPERPGQPRGQGVLEPVLEDIFRPLDRQREHHPFKIEPPFYLLPTFPDFINEMSPMFRSIYAEALEAKERGLLQIAGPGFRKALEFLIKDYVISVEGEARRNVVEQMALANVIASHMTDRVKSMAERATWLGNDETHYKKRFEEFDITHVIDLIRLTVNWMDDV